jgi:hypothetical protein
MNKRSYPHYNDKHLTQVKSADWKIGDEPRTRSALYHPSYYCLNDERLSWVVNRPPAVKIECPLTRNPRY